MGKGAGQFPLRSMTGFARVSFGDPAVEIDVEIRSVNHRFLEVVVKAPRCYSSLERDVKGAIQQHHKRGRIEVSVSRRQRGEAPSADGDFSAAFDSAVKRFSAACKRYGARVDSMAEFLGQLVLRESADSSDNAAPGDHEVSSLLRIVSEASQALAVMREAEGAGLGQDIAQRLALIEASVHEMSRLAAGAPKRLRERLEERLKGLAPELKADPERLASEVAMLADRVDVSEEISRLAIHFAHFRDAMSGKGDGVGRKLDFMTQEIGRELNTIGSKAQDAAVQGLVVDAKTELERIREQVQNVE